MATTSESRVTPGSAQAADHAALRRAAVEQDRRAVGRLDQRRVALADVEEGDRGRVGRRVAPQARRAQQQPHRREEADGRAASRRAASLPTSLDGGVSRPERGPRHGA